MGNKMFKGSGASKKPLTAVKSSAPMTPVRTAEALPQLQSKELGSLHKYTLQNPPAKKGDSARLAKASGIKLPADALTGSKKFGKHIGCC